MARGFVVGLALMTFGVGCERAGSVAETGTTGAPTGSSDATASSGGTIACEGATVWPDPIQTLGSDEPGVRGVASIAVRDQRVYACTDGAGVVVWDLADAAAPTLVQRDVWFAGAGSARCDQIVISADGSTLAVARRADADGDGGMVGVITVGPDATVSPAASGLDGEPVQGVAWLDDGRSVAALGAAGLRVFADAGDGTLADMGTFVDADADARRAVAFGDRLVVAEGRTGVRVYNVAGGDPALLGAAGLGAKAVDVEVDPARAVAYVATIDNVAAVDVANATPQVLAQVPTPGTAVEVAALGDHLWVADWERVRMLDVSDPAAPVVLGDEPVVGSPALPRARTVAVAGASLLVGEWTGVHVHAIEPGAFAPDISLDTRALSFAAVQVGEADARVVVLRNVGTEPLEICAITPLLDGLTVDTSSATVQPQAALTFEASWTASSTDPVEGSIAIASDDPDQPVVHVPVRGNDPGIGVGDPMPAFFHVDHDGRSRAHTELEGKVAVLAYFATWCGACNEHFPDYDVVLWQGYRDQDFAIWGLGNETLAKILAFAGSTGATFPLLLGETTYQAYDDPPGSNYSLEVVVDRQGIVRAIGHEELTAQVLEPLVVELLAE